jgi:predicted O-methyltransferase YrrM
MPISTPIRSFLSTLHAQSLSQEQNIDSAHMKTLYNKQSTNPTDAIAEIDAIMLDKFIAIDEDKALFIHNLLLAINAHVVVEAGTSFGVSTVYWSLAAMANAKRSGKIAKVIGTEKESKKAERARTVWAECKEKGTDVGSVIELREGDLTETLKGDLGLAADQYVDALVLDSESNYPHGQLRTDVGYSQFGHMLHCQLLSLLNTSSALEALS